ncbi:hypothetical protein ST201phi2-1p310 [Pseudomonas phage 201phi2-1]|uniref:Uncharacterized protein n=1 Tax=Pseudomonas phage 201phi2-1 TaxID=198110 RepID=B3FJH0_BP201|nr:hypothetical protein ST201phi2-1p310 [Pseudomonas phage 201phi2-1]ABY63136.1 hypothetical protein 201phi2-1p310 [Pseudomonas phage 201phi2-1]
MKSNSGFRIEVSPNTKLGKRLISLSVHLRNRSDAVRITRKILVYVKGLGVVAGKWTVRQSGAISFKGITSECGEIEYIYGKLTIGLNLNSPGHQVWLPRDKTIRLMSQLIVTAFPHVNYNLTERDLNSKLIIR